jgi:hypothetical protein
VADIERIERIASTASAGISRTLERLTSLAAMVLLITAVVCIATFATGWWVFDGSVGWMLVGGVLCLVPIGAAATAWFYVRTSASSAPKLIDDVRSLLRQSNSAATVLIDHDSGIALGAQAKSLGGLRRELIERRTELPALFAGVRAITSVPGLAAVAVLGVVLMGIFGTILLVVGLIG